MNEDKPTWWSFYAWPLIGAGLTFSVVGAMTIGLFVFPFVLAGFFAMLKWGGNRKSSVGLISGAGLPILFIAYINRDGPGDICTPYDHGGQQCSQEYSPWPFLIIGLALVLLGMLIFFRMRSGSAISSRTKGLLVVVLVVGVLIFGLIAAPSTRSPEDTELGRVQNAFNGMSALVAKKVGVPPSWLTSVRAGVVSYPDGSTASLWVPKSASGGLRSGCFYVDQSRNGSAIGGFSVASCAIPKSEVILERQGSIVVGFERMPRVPAARITSGGITVDAPITLGYFIFPSSVSMNPKAMFTITLIEPGGASCKVTDLVAPGSSTIVTCEIA